MTGHFFQKSFPSSRFFGRAEFHPDLILLDVIMPGLDGCDLSARIHTEPELHDTPIVFLTALATSDDTSGGMMIAGLTVYVAKPAILGELIKCIDQYVRQ
jgi:CheY-like chemotaxis protein